MKTLFTAFILTISANAFAQPATQYKIINRIPLEGNQGWDYLASDDHTNRLFVSHGNMVQVLDLNKGRKLAGTITGLHGVHGIAIANDLNKGFISSGKDSSVLVFDLTSLATLAKIKVTGANPDAIVYDKFTKRVFTFNGKSRNSTVIDAKTYAIIGTIVLPGKPEFAVADGKGKLYDNIESMSEICEINTTTMKVENNWSIAPGESPSGLAIDAKHGFLFSVCHNKLMVISSTKSMSVFKTLPIGKKPDGAEIDYNTHRIYSSNGDGTLTVVQETIIKESDGKAKISFDIIQNVPTQKGARTCAVNSKTHHIYLSSAQYGVAPAPTAIMPKPRPPILSNSFAILDVEPSLVSGQ